MEKLPTPKEKAEELLSKYYFQVTTLEKQKQCAFITIDEIVEYLESNLITGTIMTYWNEVKKEIEAL